MSSDWYLIRTKSRNEARALENLTRQGYDCYLPLVEIEKITTKGLVRSKEPLFPRYLFVQLSSIDDNWSPIRSTLGVTEMVKFGSDYAKVPGGVIEDIQRFSSNHTQKLFAAGDKLTITSGPFKGIEAEFKAMDSDSRAFVLIEILNKIQTLKIDVTAIRSN